MCSLCTALCSHSVLALQDSTQPFQIQSDALDIAVGSILTQEHASVHKTIAILSKMLISSHKNYCVHYCDLLEIVTYCKA